MNLDFYFFMAKSRILVTPKKGIFIGNSPLLSKNNSSYLGENFVALKNLGIIFFTIFLFF
jgi:hypothetical protein